VLDVYSHIYNFLFPVLPETTMHKQFWHLLIWFHPLWEHNWYDSFFVDFLLCTVIVYMLDNCQNFWSMVFLSLHLLELIFSSININLMTCVSDKSTYFQSTINGPNYLWVWTLFTILKIPFLLIPSTSILYLAACLVREVEEGRGRIDTLNISCCAPIKVTYYFT
jgi:hypothetical protein